MVCIAPVIPDAILVDGCPPAEALAELLEKAAQLYARDPNARGCLVLEACRGGADAESVRLAREALDERRDRIRAFIAQTHPQVAGVVSDFVACTLSGLSATAREGMSKSRLVAIARTASISVRSLLES